MSGRSLSQRGTLRQPAERAAFTSVPINTETPARRLIGDGDMFVASGSTNPATIKLTETARQLVIVVNLGTENLMVVEGAVGALAAPGSGYVSVPVGSEYVSTTSQPIFGYFPTTAGTVRVYSEQGA